MSDLEFEEATHTYRKDGVILPGVTSILTSVGIIDPSKYDERGKVRGKAVHLACEFYDEEDLEEEAVHPEILLYLKAWKSFLSDSSAVIRSIEKKVHSETFRFAGTLDREIFFPGIGEMIIEIKSGSFEDWWALQTAAYEICSPLPRARGAVELRSNGTYKFHEFKDRNDKKTFINAVSLVHWMQRKGVKNGFQSSVAA